MGNGLVSLGTLVIFGGINVLEGCADRGKKKTKTFLKGSRIAIKRKQKQVLKGSRIAEKRK